MPDAVDGVGGILLRGHLGQWYGHTLLGMHVFCLPFGIALTWATLWLGRWLAQPRLSPTPRWPKRLGAWLLSLHTPPPQAGPWGRFGFVLISLWVGTFSHLFFDLVSHGGFRWFYPWHKNIRLFPDWWYARWLEISPPGYIKYPIGPHFMVWLFLSILGLIMLFWPWIRPNRS